jgi:hypothetical protein
MDNYESIYENYLTDPVFVGRYACNSGRGHTFIFKMGDKYYSTHPKTFNKGSINLRCRKYLSSACKFTVTLKMLHLFDPATPGFYDTKNFEVKISKVSGTHSCQGYDTALEANSSKL